MTQPKDQERVEFEEIMRDSQSYKPELLNRLGDSYEFDTMESAWQGFLLGVQAARRAPVVPQFSSVAQTKLGYLLEAGEAITGYAIENKDGRRGAIDCHGFVYWWNDAAAPKPPESLKRENPVTKPEGAPVQLPEPDINTANHVGLRVVGYTPETVRQLLAKHGIK